MASAVKFQSFVTRLAAGTHAAALNADTDTLKVYLTNTAPNVSSHAYRADLAEISAGSGYTSGGIDAQNAATTSTGTITVAGTDVTWTASSGTIGPFRYAVLYNDTPTTPSADPLIQYWDYGSSITLADGESFTVDFGASLFTVA
jgi:hypothetical protein